MTISTGARFNHYEILAPLGAGGMGEVYLAEDISLSRKVALKLLPAEFTQDAARVRRFVQEAKAASALNHPNILTIHEIGEAAGAHFIATEYIDGTTLRQRLAGARLALNVALDIAIQTASALSAAHEAGIVHRDIKPENVMLRRDGIVKVLDFGLAKLTEHRPAAVDSEAPTIAKVSTDPGTVMGTANYMSPEQARGQEVDARSDIFSLGMVLYEILAGRAPFVGVNALEVISEILKTEPAPLRQHAPDLPAELQRIVNKTLRKDRDERYQHVKDLLLDLKDLKQELEFAAKLKGVQAQTGSEASATTAPAPTEAATQAVAAARTTSSAEYLVSQIRQHRLGALITLCVMLGVVAALAYGLYRFAAPERVRFQQVKISRLTSLGNVGLGASISPDGKFIAYVRTEGGQHSLWTKAVATGSAVQIIPPSEFELADTTFSPDGDYIYYRRRERPYSLYQIPVLGGTPKKVLTDIDSPITFSPDGKQFAFARRNADRTKSQIVVVRADGSGERVLAKRESRELFWIPAWSPDGKIIAATASHPGDATQERTLLGVALESGEVKPLVQLQSSLRFMHNLTWFADGSGLVLTGTENYEGQSSNPQIWQLSYPGGVARRLTNDFAAYTALSLTADNRALTALQTEIYSTLWVTPLSGGGAQQLTVQGSNRDGFGGVKWTPDGGIVYTSIAGGPSDLWLMNADGSNLKQLTDDVASNISPIISPDGRYIVFVSRRNGRENIWRTDFDGRNPKQLTEGEAGRGFDLSPDGRWVIFEKRAPGAINLHKVSIDGGSAVPLIDQPANSPAVSPDGKLIACRSVEPQSRQPQLLIIPFAGGAPLKTLDVKTIDSNIIAVGSLPLRWMPDGGSLIYLDSRQGAANLWRLPLDGGSAQPVTNFSDARRERILAFDLSRDGKQLVLARGGISADVVLISEVK